jgi:hypothetical protein
MDIDTELELVSVTTWALLVVFWTWFGKVNGFGARVALGAAPVPDSVTICAPLVPLSVKVRVPDAVPEAVGWK